MELLKEIVDESIPASKSNLKVRKASRAVLFDKEGFIPLLFVSNYNYHKLPGGGIDADETNLQALEREIKEETGSKIEVLGAIGEIVEYRSKYNFKIVRDLMQISYCYIGNIVAKGKPSFTKEEMDEGLMLKWMTLDEAINKVHDDKPKNYEGTFVKQRALTFLNRAKEIMKNDGI